MRLRSEHPEDDLSALRAIASARPYVMGAALATLVCAFALAFRRWLSVTDISMLMLVAILWSSIGFGLWPSILLSSAAGLAVNYLFVEPSFDFAYDSHAILTLAVFVVTAVTMSYWAGMARRQAEALSRVARSAERRRSEAELLQQLANRLNGIVDPGAIVSLTAEALQSASAVALFEPAGDRVRLVAASAAGAVGAAELRAAQAAFERRVPTGLGTLIESDAALHMVPLRGEGAAIGVVGLGYDSAAGVPWTEALPTMLADQLSVAIQRARLAEQIEESRLFAETEKLRSALLSSISHDFRTPLASIIGSASSLLHEDAQFTAAARRQLLETILTSGERLHRYIGNVLDMTRLEAKVLQLNRDWAEVTDLVGTAVSHIGAPADRQRIRLDIAPGLPMLHVDFVLIEQVLLNLLDNAIKYSPAGSEILLSAREDPGTVVLVVTNVLDGGEAPATTSADYDRLFDRFHRAGMAPRHAGTGLGLTICKGFVEAHHGAIQAGPSPGGRGLSVEVTLPVEPAARRVALEAVADD
ncbi:MAG: ATP-binding protein [Rhodospirillales bacterium]